jgi:hypothetical protein
MSSICDVTRFCLVCTYLDWLVDRERIRLAVESFCAGLRNFSDLVQYESYDNSEVLECHSDESRLRNDFCIPRTTLLVRSAKSYETSSALELYQTVSYEVSKRFL